MSPIDYVTREFANPRRIAFNIFWYGSQIGLFAYGWWAQVRLSFRDGYLFLV